VAKSIQTQKTNRNPTQNLIISKFKRDKLGSATGPKFTRQDQVPKSKLAHTSRSKPPKNQVRVDFFLLGFALVFLQNQYLNRGLRTRINRTVDGLKK
jgi:hypothetical protein